MKALIKHLNAKPGYAKIFMWGRLIAISGSAQVLVQVLGFVSGIIVIRLLPTKEYALYTLANTMLGTLALLADGGVSAGVMAQGGKHWQNRQKLGEVIATGLHLRRKFAIGSLIISVPALGYLLILHGASWLMCILIIASIIPAFYAALSDNILEIGPKLRQDIIPLQKNLIAANVGRLLMITLTLFIFPWTFVAVLGNGIPRIWANIRLRKIAGRYADLDQHPNPLIQKEILVTVRRILPGAIYYCVSGQITIWIISIVGSTSSVAQVGALGRLAMLIGLFGVLFGTLVVPRFSRLAANPTKILKNYIFIQIALLALCAVIMACSFLFTKQMLWLLGKNYADLKNEIILSIAGSCLALIVTASFSINTSRGWTLSPLISIPVSILAIACGAYFINVATIKGILWLNIFVGAVEVLMYVFYGLFKIFKLPGAVA